MRVVAIFKTDPSSLMGIPRQVATAIDEAAALRWVEQETTKPDYMNGQPPEFWINDYPMFSFETIEVFGG